ncbi:MAG: DUF2062 domain-containing protein [Verrucomicrobiota bacterium]
MKKRYLQLVRRTFRALRHPRLRHRNWWQRMTKPVRNRALWIPCRDSVASGLAIGLFFSMILIPFQTVPAALLAMRTKSNVPFTMLACWITNPITSPPIIWLQNHLGRWMIDVLHVPMPDFLAHHTTVPKVGTLGMDSFLLGMIVSAVILALAAYPIVHLFSAIMPHHLPVRNRGKRNRVAPKPSEILP